MFASFMTWLANPFDASNGGPSAYLLFLAIGLVLVMLAAWGMIFRHIRAAV